MNPASSAPTRPLATGAGTPDGQLDGRGTPGRSFDAHYRIISATGGLEGLQAQGTLSGPVPSTYSGEHHLRVAQSATVRPRARISSTCTRPRRRAIRTSISPAPTRSPVASKRFTPSGSRGSRPTVLPSAATERPSIVRMQRNGEAADHASGTHATG